MAMYRCEARIIGRKNRGYSAVAASAYRTGSKLTDERSGKTHDFSRRTKGIIETAILCPEGSPEWVKDRSRLWNEVEKMEGRKDSQLAREFILAVPPEISPKEQFQAAVDWAQKELVSQGMIVEVSLHHCKGGHNPHVHILATMRRLDGDKFSVKKERKWNETAVLVSQRETWGQFENKALEKAGRSERVDHRSLKDQGIDRIPQPKIGRKAIGMKLRGLIADPERFKLVRWAKSLNAVRPWLKDLTQGKEVHQEGIGNTWWERSLYLAGQAKNTARDTLIDKWSRVLRGRQHNEDLPPQDRGMDR